MADLIPTNAVAEARRKFAAAQATSPPLHRVATHTPPPTQPSLSVSSSNPPHVVIIEPPQAAAKPAVKSALKSSPSTTGEHVHKGVAIAPTLVIEATTGVKKLYRTSSKRRTGAKLDSIPDDGSSTR